MTAMGQVPGIAGYKVSIRSGHYNFVIPQKLSRGSLICVKTVFLSLKKVPPLTCCKEISETMRVIANYCSNLLINNE